MSFADYTSLSATLTTNWLNRGDLTSQADDFIALFEADFNSKMRVRQMEAETSVVSTSGWLPLPTGWLSWKSIRGTTTGTAVPYSLEAVTEEAALARTPGETGDSRLYNVSGSRTYLYPANSGISFATTFYAGVTLSATKSGTNWLLTSYPAAYLYGSLLQATAFLMNDPRVPLWKAAHDDVMQRIKADSNTQGWPQGQAIRMSPDFRIV